MQVDDLEKKLFDKSWNYKNRDNLIKKLSKNKYDLCIIGAGITGAGIAREAAMRGLSVAIVDMQDFAAGTSSRSSKMAHGGLRYLTYGEMDLVRDATQERNWMRAHIPHLVRPLPFLLPYRKEGTNKKRVIQSAMKIYDFLGENNSDFKNFKPYKEYSPDELSEIEPTYLKEEILGGYVYYDTNLDDARLTIEILKEALVRGADVVNYCQVTKYIKENEEIIGVKCQDLENDVYFEILSKLVINATGVWTDQLLDNYPEIIPKPLIRPTKGVHIQIRREHIKNNFAVVLNSIDDNRVFFVIPRDKNFTIIGTTDTDYQGELAHPFCTKEDVDYLIRSTKHYFPDSQLSYENILSTYAGLRPLVRQKGKSESEVSRSHIIFFSDDGLLTITGGKLTEWRSMAEDLLEKISEKKIFGDIGREKNYSRKKFMITLEKEEWLNEFKNSRVELDESIADHLYQQYGKGALKILDIIRENESLKERLIEENDFIKAEIIYCLRYELTLHLIDVFCRRTEMALWIYHKKSLKAAEIVADIMAKEYSWDAARKGDEINTYLTYIKNSISFL
ncbi:MAG: Glycerol-3-phosphate dehydrogenase [Candidatus Lokiarchaeum sp. GC14_75]|nr:MAG: Glycerol-3-phosphate dehydrogenase [Candidatus Lokiarchaeum sp. GC14_75]